MWQHITTSVISRVIYRVIYNYEWSINRWESPSLCCIVLMDGGLQSSHNILTCLNSYVSFFISDMVGSEQRTLAPFWPLWLQRLLFMLLQPEHFRQFHQQGNQEWRPYVRLKVEASFLHAWAACGDFYCSVHVAICCYSLLWNDRQVKFSVTLTSQSLTICSNPTKINCARERSTGGRLNLT